MPGTYTPSTLGKTLSGTRRKTKLSAVAPESPKASGVFLVEGEAEVLV